MAVKIRLQRKGRKKLPFYYIVVADSRSPRDGRFIERIGSYNPLPKFPEIEIDIDKSINWLDKGAIPTKTVKSILTQKGVLYKKHLLRGVKLGVVTQEQADEKFAIYMNDKSEKYSKQLEKLKEVLDKSSKTSLEREVKVNEVKAKKLMEKRAQALKAKAHKAEAVEEETVEPEEEAQAEEIAETQE